MGSRALLLTHSDALSLPSFVASKFPLPYSHMEGAEGLK